MARRPAAASTPRLARIGSSGTTSGPFLGASPAARWTAAGSTMARRLAAASTPRLRRLRRGGRMTSEGESARGTGPQCASQRRGLWKGLCLRRRVDPAITGLGLETGPSSRPVSSRCPVARCPGHPAWTVGHASASRTPHLRTPSPGQLHVRPNRERVTGIPPAADRAGTQGRARVSPPAPPSRRRRVPFSSHGLPRKLRLLQPVINLVCDDRHRNCCGSRGPRNRSSRTVERALPTGVPAGGTGAR
jgi:hypothetical protein